MKKTLLVILDGVWINTFSREENPFYQASYSMFHSLFSKMTTQLDASGRAVGIPDGQIGNSEVGHMTIGAGRIIPQSIVKIDDLLDDGSFSEIEGFQQGIRFAQNNGWILHLFTLFWPGWVHSSDTHLKKILSILPSSLEISLHLFWDGRDIEPKSFWELYKEFETTILKQYPNVRVSSLSGRYFAMDRDNNWERIQQAYDVIVLGKNPTQLSVTQYVENEYQKGKTDEFFTPVFFEGGKAVAENDAVFFLNFRSDRAKQLTKAFVEPTFSGFERKVFSNIFFATMTKYYKEYAGNYFIPDEEVKNVLGEVIQNAWYTQLHIAETEKFAHATKFFNGGNNSPFEREADVLIPSHKVATYDLDPEMSADEIYEAFVKNIDSFDFCVINFANGDMVGHTGNMEAVKKTLKKLNQVLDRIIEVCKTHQIELLVSADHGNCEEMGTLEAPKTAHTTNYVPFWYIHEGEVVPTKVFGWLANIAPTVLEIMGIDVPSEMSESLLLK